MKNLAVIGDYRQWSEFTGQWSRTKKTAPSRELVRAARGRQHVIDAPRPARCDVCAARKRCAPQPFKPSRRS